MCSHVIFNLHFHLNVVQISSDTYHLGQNCGFNRQFNDTTTNQKYTFFVPRDRAWQQARVTMPSAIKKLFMLDFCYYVSTLECIAGV